MQKKCWWHRAGCGRFRCYGDGAPQCVGRVDVGQGPRAAGDVEVQATDASPIDRVELTVNGSSAGTKHSAPYTFDVILQVGQVTLEVAAIDNQGNRGTATAHLTVTDSLDPGTTPNPKSSRSDWLSSRSTRARR